VLFEIVGGFRSGFEYDRGVEEREEPRSARDRETGTAARPWLNCVVEPLDHSGPLPAVKLATVVGSKQQRGCEDRRGSRPRVFSFSGKMRGLAFEHLVADLALRILDQQPSLCALQ